MRWIIIALELLGLVVGGGCAHRDAQAVKVELTETYEPRFTNLEGRVAKLEDKAESEDSIREAAASANGSAQVAADAATKAIAAQLAAAPPYPEKFAPPGGTSPSFVPGPFLPSYQRGGLLIVPATPRYEGSPESLRGDSGVFTDRNGNRWAWNRNSAATSYTHSSGWVYLRKAGSDKFEGPSRCSGGSCSTGSCCGS